MARTVKFDEEEFVRAEREERRLRADYSIREDEIVSSNILQPVAMMTLDRRVPRHYKQINSFSDKQEW